MLVAVRYSLESELIKRKMAVPPKLRTWIKNDKNGRIDVT